MLKSVCVCSECDAVMLCSAPPQCDDCSLDLFALNLMQSNDCSIFRCTALQFWCDVIYMCCGFCYFSVTMAVFLASQDAIEVMFVTD